MPRGGKRPGAGRKPNDVEVYRREMERMLLACVTEADWAVVVQAALVQAQNGEAAARQWLSDRVMGRVKDEAAVSVKHTGTVKQVVEVTYTRRGRDPAGAPGVAPGPGADQA